MGFRHYFNVSSVHSSSSFSIGRNVAAINYAANSDILVNFYTHKVFDIGAFIGINVGGTSFNGDYIDSVAKSASGVGSKMQRHFADAGVNFGLRFNFNQYLEITSQRTCKPHPTKQNEVVDGKVRKFRLCQTPTLNLMHGLEFAVRYGLMEYNLTDKNDINGGTATDANGNTGMRIFFLSQIKIKSPWRFGVRYTIGF